MFNGAFNCKWIPEVNYLRSFFPEFACSCYALCCFLKGGFPAYPFNILHVIKLTEQTAGEGVILSLFLYLGPVMWNQWTIQQMQLRQWRTESSNGFTSLETINKSIKDVLLQSAFRQRLSNTNVASEDRLHINV